MRLFVAGWVHSNDFSFVDGTRHMEDLLGNFLLLVGILCCWMGTFTQLSIVLDGTRHIEDLLQTTSMQVDAWLVWLANFRSSYTRTLRRELGQG